MAVYEMEFCVQGYHVYKDIWAAMIGEDLLFEREPFNVVDICAVAGHHCRPYSETDIKNLFFVYSKRWCHSLYIVL